MSDTINTISRETVKEWLNSIGVYGYDWQVDELPSAEPQWIPCSDHEPTENGNYLITLFDGKEKYTTTASYWTDLSEIDIIFPPGKKGWYWRDCDFDYYELHGVLAWAPKPEPYEGK